MEVHVTPSNTVRRLAVIGGGISGLAAAHRAYRIAPTIRLSIFEATSRWGGILHTRHQDGYLCEQSADSFLVTTQVPWAHHLAEEIGFADQLITTNPNHRRAMVWLDGREYPVPNGFQLIAPAKMGPVMKSKILSWRGKARLACERMIPRRTDGIEESLQQFAVRRVGQEAYERLVQPLVAGIYPSDPTRLSVAAALPQFLEMERQFGSLSRGLAHRNLPREESAMPTASGDRYSLFMTPRNGLSSFVEAIARALPPDSLRSRTKVQSIGRGEQGSWRLHFHSGAPPENFDAVVVALPAYATAAIVRELAPQLAKHLESIPYGGTTVAAVGYHRDQIKHPLNAFGLVIPSCERRSLSAISFASVKFNRRAPDGDVLLRVFLGRSDQQEMVDSDDQRLKQVVRRELRGMLGAEGDPSLFIVSRSQQHSPLYELGHGQRIQAIEQELLGLSGLYLAGHAFRGTGIPQCIHSGSVAAKRALAAH